MARGVRRRGRKHVLSAALALALLVPRAAPAQSIGDRYDALVALFTSALEEMRARCLLTYTPKGEARAGWHELKVRLRSGRADIIARPGYFVAAASPSGSSPPR